MFTLIKSNDSLYLVDSLHGGRWEISYDFAENYLYYLLNKDSIRQRSLRNIINFKGNHELQLDILNNVSDEINKYRLPTQFAYHIPTIYNNLLSSKNVQNDIITPPLPIIEVGRKCNYRCLWCYNDSDVLKLSSQENHIYDIETMKEKVILPLVSMGQTEFCLTGGEPALFLNEVELITASIKQSLSKLNKIPRIWLLTNGYNLHKNAEKYLEYGITNIQVSLASPFKEKDNYLRRAPHNVDSYKECVEGIRRLKNLSDIMIEINMILQPESYFHEWSNIHDIHEMVNLALSLGVNTLRIIPAVPSGEAKKNRIYFTIDEYKKISDTVLLINSDPKILDSDLFIDCPLGHDMNGKVHDCRAGYMYLYVNSYGYVYPCNNLQDKINICWDKPISSISDFNIVDIWKNSDLLHHFRTNNELCNECLSCKHRAECIGQCRALTYHRHKKYNLDFVPDTCMIKQYSKSVK